MRTKDDAPIRIKLMVFYELKEIETMVGDIKESLYQNMILYVYITGFIIFCVINSHLGYNGSLFTF